MPIGIGLAVASIAGGLMSSNASSNAANVQANAANQSSANTMAMFNQEQQNIQPWMATGRNAMTTLSGMVEPGGALYKPFTMSQFWQDPSYQWQLQQGDQALMDQASRYGGRLSGNTMRSLINYNQGMASTDYQTALGNYRNWQNDVFSRLNALSGTGANAAAGIAGMGMNAVNNSNAALMGGANAEAAGIVGSSNAMLNGLGQGINNYMTYNAMMSNPSLTSGVPTNYVSTGAW